MLTELLPTISWWFCDMRASRPQHAVMGAFDEWPAKPGRSEHAERNQAGHLRPRIPPADQKALLRFATRFLPLLAALMAPLWSRTQAADHGVGASMAFDTHTQVERFAALFSGDPHSDVASVNANEPDPSAAHSSTSHIYDFAHRRGTERGHLPDHPHPGGRHEHRYGRSAVERAAYFSRFGVKERAV